MFLGKSSGKFDFLRLKGDEYQGVSEKKCLTVLKSLDLKSYETFKDLPLTVLHEILVQLIDDDYSIIEHQFEQEILSILQDCSVKSKFDITIFAKILRYLLRKDTSKKSALLVVDVQNDFISGSLALKNSPAQQDGEEVVEIINNVIESYDFDLVVYTIDWHPKDHCSFITNVDKYPIHETSPISAKDAKMFDKVIFKGETIMEQVLWPEHCVQGSKGAEFHPDLKVLPEGEKSIQVRKGLSKHVDSYSAFWDNGHLAQTDLFTQLLDRDITTVFTCGLATDFCVAYTAFDSNKHGFQTFVVDDACRGVSHESIEAMKCEKRRCKIEIIESSEIQKYLR